MSTVFSHNRKLISSISFNDEVIQLVFQPSNVNARRRSVTFKKRLGISLNIEECVNAVFFFKISTITMKKEIIIHFIHGYATVETHSVSYRTFLFEPCIFISI